VTDETAINAQLAGIELNDLWDVAARFAARLRAIGIANPLPSSAPIRGSSASASISCLSGLVPELRGIPCIALEEVTPDRKRLTRVKLRQA
jgi:DNA polymerase V